MNTDLTERGLERLVCKALTGDPCDPPHRSHHRRTGGGRG